MILKKDYSFTLDRDPEFNDEPDFDDEMDEQDFDCGFAPGYGCQLAGTEDCDFDCPYRDRLEASSHYPNCDLFGLPMGGDR